MSVFSIKALVMGACLQAVHLAILPPGVANAGNTGALVDIRINGQPGRVTLRPDQPFEFCARPKEFYTFSGRTNQSFGVPLVIAPVTGAGPSRRKAVGLDGQNSPKDVRLVQTALRDSGVFDGGIDGRVTDALLEGMDDYLRSQRSGQREVPPVPSHVRELFEGSHHYLLRLGRTSTFRGARGATQQPDDIGGSYRCVEMVAPAKPGAYRIRYNVVPAFLEKSAAIGAGWIDDAFRKPHLMRSVAGEFEVQRGEPAEARPFALYLRVNGDLPGSGGKASLKGGYAERPIEFSWYTKEKETGPADTYAGVEFRYRLSPVETAWSSWRQQRAVPYFFIMPGRHSFEVESRYPGRDGAWRSGGFSFYEFTLSTAFVSRHASAVVAKGDGSDGKGFTPLADAVDRSQLAKIYPASRAFLAGVQTYADPQLSPLPFVDRDLDAMKSALSDLQFELGHVHLNPTRDELISGLEAFVKTVSEGDRVVLYFSMHGFQDQDAKSRAYIAPKDCRWDAPGVYCVPLTILSEYVLRLNRRGARHVVVVLDTCSAGLGILEKSAQTPFFEMKMAEASGAHMITAGLADQKALMDNDKLKMSYFTHFLVEGLRGRADLTRDGVISLSELLVYVRGEVARVSDGSQTPMMGRLNGGGEMVFVASTSR